MKNPLTKIRLQAEVPGQKDRFLVFPFGLLWNEVTASNLLLVDMDGNVLKGEGQPEATAFWIHRCAPWRSTNLYT